MKEARGDEEGRYFRLHSRASGEADVLARDFAPFVTSRLEVFTQNDVSLVHKHTKERNSCILARFLHTVMHTAQPAPPVLVLSPPRGTEIFLSSIKPKR